MTRLRVALVLGGLEGAPARTALAAALALGEEAYEHTVIATEPGPEAVVARDRSTLTRLLAEGGYDVVHTYGGTMGRLAAARAGVLRVVHTWFTPPRRSAGEFLAARHTDVFLAVGADTAARALRLGLAAPELLRTIWPAVDLPEVAGTRARARRLLDLPLGARIVGATGSAGRPELFARAIALLPHDVYGVWVGDGRVSRRLDGDRVRRVSGEVAGLAPAFDVLAMPGRREGVPYAAVEATVAGVPLVGTLTHYGPDIIRAGETGLLTAPGDPGGLADAIAHLLDNPAEARRMNRAALSRVAERYRPESLAGVLDSAYRGVTSHFRCTSTL